jgi:hypothetical protein
MAEATFEVFSASIADVHHFADAQCEALKAAYFELRCLGIMADDFGLIWPQGPRSQPAWDYVEARGDKVHDMVFKIEMVSAAMRLAHQELAFRSRPN